MASKKLFFNFNMIIRDIKMHWPIWLMGMLGYTFTCTAVIALGFPRYELTHDYDIAYSVVQSLTETTHLFSICMGLAVALASFGYLTKKRKHYFYESLPFNRLSLFATRYLFGVITIAIPVVSLYIIELIQTTFYGYFAIWELTQWMIISLAEYLFWYSLGVFVVILCGRYGMACFCYIAVSVAWMLFEVLLDAYSQLLYVGVKSGLGLFEFTSYNILSPIEFFTEIETRASYDLDGSAYFYQEGTFVKVLIALIAVVVLTVVAYLLYERRKSEKTDDNFVFPAVRVVFNWCFALYSALGFGLFFIALFISAGEGQAHIMSHRAGILVILLILGFTGYMSSCMIAEKKFRVFGQNMVKCCIFLGVLALLMIGMFHDVFKIEKYVPDKEDCKEATIIGEYSPDGKYKNYHTYNKAGVNKTVELLQLVIDNFDDVCGEYSYDTYFEDTKRLQIHIEMDKGNIRRMYYVTEGSNLDKKLKEFMKENIRLFTDRNSGYYEYEDAYEHEVYYDYYD
ncbi:MAG: hypothetical protein K6A45_06545 [Lachnospiraceae bacterium]|nr:hypothetical protein [Lachnospiraceae bacterium]